MRNDVTGQETPKRWAMVELARVEALELLAEAPVGRVVFSWEALPAVRPVNFTLVDDDVVFRIRGDSGLARALRGNVVAFEADEFDAHHRIGWSVVVTGVAELLDAGVDFERLDAELGRPWAPGPYDRIVRIQAQLVTGRRIARSSSAGPDAAMAD